MKAILAAALLLFSMNAFAVEVVGDVTTEVTHCRVYHNDADVGIVPSTNQECVWNIDGISNGQQKFEMTAIVDDGIFMEESVKSVPLVFVKPGQPSAPGTLRLRK